MFSRRNCIASNVQIMQLFHEVKQQFPTVSDEVISACISAQLIQKSKDSNRSKDLSRIVNSLEQFNRQLMGKSASSFPSSTSAVELCTPSVNSNSFTPTEKDILPDSNLLNKQTSQNTESDAAMSSTLNPKDSNVTKDTEKKSMLRKPDLPLQRPTNLALPSQTSRKKENVPPSGNYSCATSSTCDKQAKSSLNMTNNTVNSDKCDKQTDVVSESDNFEKLVRKETVETPTQTTDTLLSEPGVNFSVNFNCSMDYARKNSGQHMSSVIVTPTQPWLFQPSTHRNYTSVNLTLRPPSSEPQPPIDITSKNSSLTYSTSSFDSQKGLESRLQITVGPTGSSVSSLRTRPKSTYHPKDEETVVMTRAESLPDLTVTKKSVIPKQQARIERLKIELSTEKAKLTILRRDVNHLEDNSPLALEAKDVQQMEEQLRKEIRHLNFQCEQLASAVNKCNLGQAQEHFYNNIYTGQKGPVVLDVTTRIENGNISLSEANHSKWHCHLCTFLNHPDLNKCEQCEMGRIVYGYKSANTC